MQIEGATHLISAKDKKLLVKVIKANQLGSQKGILAVHQMLATLSNSIRVPGCHQVFCIIEMDEPAQRHQTTIKRDTDNPFWDESFLLLVIL